MGGTTSSAEIGPQRLSKPRTKTSKDLLKLTEREPSSPISTADTYVFGDESYDIDSSSGDRRSRRTTRSKIRGFLYGAVQRKPRSDESVDEGEGQRVLGDIATGRKFRLSEIGSKSSIEQLSSPFASSSHISNFASSKLLLPYENLSSNHLPSCSNSKLLLPYEAMIPESARVAMEIMEKAYSDSIVAQNHVPPPVDEDMHVDSVLSPIRRRSLYTPGIATRTPNDILRKPPPPNQVLSQADRDYYFNPSLSESSPLGRLAALEIGNCGRSTPASLEYSHLGGLKPGTLRVTNGTTSPMPPDVNPLRMHPPTPESADRDKCSMVSEEGKSHNESQYSTNDHAILENFQDTSTSQAQSNPRSSKVDYSGGQNDNLNLRALMEGGDFEAEGWSDDGLGREGTTDYTPNTSQDTTFSSYPNASSAKSLDQALCIAQDYMQELPNSPFTYAESSRYSSLNLEHMPPTDKANDHSFDDEGIFISKSPRPILDLWRSFIDSTEVRHANDASREDAFRRLNANKRAQSVSITRTGSSSTTSIKTDLTGNNTKRFVVNSAHQPDSGYSSTSTALTKTDLTGNNTKPFVVNAAHQSDSGYSSSDSLKNYVNSAHIDSMGHSNLGNTRVSLPILYQCDSRPGEIPRSALHSTGSDGVKPLATQKSAHTPSSVIAIATMAEPAPVSERERIRDSTATLQSASNNLPQRLATVRKLQKARPLSQPTPAHLLFVQGIRNLSQSNIPPVPSDIVIRHIERLREFPLLEHTFPTRHHVKTDDSLPAEELTALPIRFPSPANTLERGDSIIRSDLDWPSSKSKRPKSVSRGSWSVRGKAQRRKIQSEASSAIANFGTENIGDGPCDIARSATSPPNRYNGNMSRLRQKSNATPRPRSLIAMEDGVAAESASTRSRQRIHSFSRIHGRPWARVGSDVEIAGKIGRPRSMFVNSTPIPHLPNQGHIDICPPSAPKSMKTSSASVGNRVGISGHRMLADVPPVPVLPTKQQVAQWEARVSTSNSTKHNTLPPPLQIKNLVQNLKPPIQARNVVVESCKKEGDPLADWKSYREAGGYQQGKTAGDVLLLRFQALKNRRTSPLTEISPNRSEPNEYIAYKIPPKDPADPMYNTRPSPQTLSNSQNLLSQKDSTSASQSSNISCKRVAAETATFEHLTGRYAGGLSYGYEPGFGLGGSAGTRSTKSGASRKSVDVSRGYGIDLSDVPIFTPAKDMGSVNDLNV